MERIARVTAKAVAEKLHANSLTVTLDRIRFEAKLRRFQHWNKRREADGDCVLEFTDDDLRSVPLLLKLRKAEEYFDLDW